jgi:hypothetical protein
MTPLSTSFWNIKCRRLPAAVLCLAALAPAVATPAFGQGATIPRGSSKADVEVTTPLSTELPEGVKYRYPLLNGLNLSINLFEPVMHVFRNDYASYEATAQLDLHHRYLPEVTVGVGQCDDVSDDLVGYKTSLSPYFKVGAALNLRYNDVDPDYFYFVVLRYGYSHSTADITNMYYTDGYWNQYGPVDILDQTFNAHWVELGFGIQVKIWRRFSMGWDLYYKPLISDGSTKYASPYYLPGYGVTSVKFGLNYRLTYKLF